MCENGFHLVGDPVFTVYVGFAASGPFLDSHLRAQSCSVVSVGINFRFCYSIHPRKYQTQHCTCVYSVDRVVSKKTEGGIVVDSICKLRATFPESSRCGFSFCCVVPFGWVMQLLHPKP